MKAPLIIALSLALLTRAYAAPVTLELTLDTERHATAVVSGSFLETKFPDVKPDSTKYDWSGGYYRKVFLDFAKVGTNWNVWGNIALELYYTAADVFVAGVYDLSLQGQHMVAPDPGEASKGLTMLVYYDNLGGSANSADRSPPIDTWDTFPHLAGSHVDTMSLTVADLNGAEAGVLSSRQNFAASVELYHVPEGGSTLLWCGACCLGAAWFTRRRNPVHRR